MLQCQRPDCKCPGVSSGLGMTFAEALAECGTNVVLAARRTDRLEKLADTLASASELSCYSELDGTVILRLTTLKSLPT